MTYAEQDDLYERAQGWATAGFHCGRSATDGDDVAGCGIEGGMSGCLKARRKPTSSRGVIQRDWIGIVVISGTVHRSSQSVRSAQAISVLRQLEDGFRRTSPTVRSFARYAIRSSNFIQLTSSCDRATLRGVLRRRFATVICSKRRATLIMSRLGRIVLASRMYW